MQRHTRWPRWAGPALALEPLAVLLVLAAAGTHDLVRWYPEGATVATTQAAEAGLLFWPHLLYNTVLVWVATALLVVTLSRMSGLYRRQSVLLVVAILLPILLNLLFNLRVGPFRQVDLTPFAFVLTTAVLVWGVYQFSLLDLRRWPAARSSGRSATRSWCSTRRGGCWTPTRPPGGWSTGHRPRSSASRSPSCCRPGARP